MDENSWFQLQQPESVDTPALLVYPERIEFNIRQMIRIAGNPSRLMPHVKTHKMEQVVRMQIQAGIRQFKCATIAEAEMTALAGADQVLLAYQLTETKAIRLLQLIRQFPSTRFASLVDNPGSAAILEELYGREEMTGEVLIDVDNGMHRTGSGGDLVRLFNQLQANRHLLCQGFHVYDGHIRDRDFGIRRKKAEEAMAPTMEAVSRLEAEGHAGLLVIAGGTPTFTVHALNPRVTCSPGTCLLWDAGYEQMLGEQEFQFAAILMMRVISVPQEGKATLDLGHKSVAAENPIDHRIRILDPVGWKPVAQSEEHLVVELPAGAQPRPGDVVYGVPYHICPTVALYDEAHVVEGGKVTGQWPVTARRRRITI